VPRASNGIGALQIPKLFFLIYLKCKRLSLGNKWVNNGPKKAALMIMMQCQYHIILKVVLLTLLM
jgi:hypothetical protein